MLLSESDIEIIDNLCKDSDEAYKKLLKCFADKHDLAGNPISPEWLEELIFELETRARNAKSAAMALLSKVYMDAGAVEQDIPKALNYARRAASLNDARGEVMLGFMYLNGYGVVEDYKRAMKYFELALKKGHSMAINNMGAIYEGGLGVKKDLALAIKYYKQAAEMKNQLAIDNLKRLQESKLP